MANLSITTECNRRCPFCFAPPDREPKRMSPAAYAACLELIERSGQKEARILGGEPSTHPLMLEFMRSAIDRGLRIFLFTNALFDEATLRALENLPEGSFSGLVNMRPPSEESPKERALLERSLAALGTKLAPGFTIDRPRPEPSFLLEAVDRYGMRPSIRLGLAHPDPSGRNRWLHPKRYAEAGKAILPFILEAKARGMEIDYDCGFVPCMFGEDFAKLDIEPASLGKECGSIPDILFDGSAVHCYPLAGLLRSRDARSASSLDALCSSLDADMERRKAPGIYAECLDCPYKREGACRGGCAAAGLRRLRGPGGYRPESGEPIAIEASIRPRRRAERGEAQAVWALPYVDQPMEFWHRIEELSKGRIKQVYLPVPGFPSGRPPQPDTHIREFLRESPFPVSAIANPIVTGRPAAELAPALIGGIEELRRIRPLAELTLSSLELARAVKERFPGLPLCASVLMDIFKPSQLSYLEGIFDAIVPSSRVMRDRKALAALRKAFPGRIRLIVNEACLPDCPYRTQHFFEMASPDIERPESLCRGILDEKPWRGLAGAWVLPQHLELYEGLYDELKLAGRVTLRDPARYAAVLRAYLDRAETRPDAIGGGPASVSIPMRVSREFFEKTLDCDKDCAACGECERYYSENAEACHGR